MGSTIKESGFDSRQVIENFLRTIQIGSDAHPAPCPVGTSSLASGGKRQEHGINHLFQCTAEVENYGAKPPPPICLHGVVLN
jgi:hypothetical protein